MCRLRDQIRHAIAMAQPRTELARVLGRAGVPDANSEADHLLYCMKKPGRDGVRAVVNIHYFAPLESRSRILAEMFENKVHPSGFGAALARDWIDGSFSTSAAAGTPARLLAWFQYARFDLPFIRPFCSVEALPAKCTVWRVARTDAASAAAGMSWTTCREIAAHYGYEFWCLWGHTAEPILLRREITREQVLTYFVSRAGEAAVNGAGPYEVDTADPDEIAALAASAEPMLAEGEKRGELIRAATLAAPEDELFAGWEG